MLFCFCFCCQEVLNFYVSAFSFMVSGFGVKLGKTCSTLLLLKVCTQSFVSLLTFIKNFNLPGIEFMRCNFSLKVPVAPNYLVNSKSFPCDLKCHIYHTLVGGGHGEDVATS